MVKFFLYLCRWQLSTIPLAIIIQYVPSTSVLIKTIIANFVGGCMFFFIDKWIFNKKN